MDGMGNGTWWIGVWALGLTSLAGCAWQVEDPFERDPDLEADVRFMSFNVGNPDDGESDYPLRLRDQAYEDFVAEAIARWRPDVIALQEVLPPHTCEAFVETDARRTCFEHEPRDPAVRRLLGDDYSIVCDARQQVECVGVHVGFGTIVGLAPGALALTGAETPELPAPACNYAAGGCDQNLCDAESTVSALDVESIYGPLRVVHLHPNASGFTGEGIFYLGNTCRTLQTQQAFDLARDGVPTLMLGDWNFDPDNRALYGPEGEVWDAHVGEDRRYLDHGAKDPVGRRVPTVGDDPGGFAIDHVISDFARGRCDVVRPRFDEGFDFGIVGAAADGYDGRIDHHPVLCDLGWP